MDVGGLSCPVAFPAHYNPGDTVTQVPCFALALEWHGTKLANGLSLPLGDLCVGDSPEWREPPLPVLVADPPCSLPFLVPGASAVPSMRSHFLFLNIK